MRIKPVPISGVFNHTLSETPWAPPGIELMKAPYIWTQTRGSGIVVAVIDTGIDYTHPDLQKNVIGGKSLVSGESDYRDMNGHGTHVAGIIAANGKILGMAPEAKLLAVKVLNRFGYGSNASINAGIAWARKWQGKNGESVNVINMSLGGPLPNKSMHDEIIKAVNQGIIVVCAAGNSGDGNPDTSEISFPAYYPETIGVGAVDLKTGIADFSNSNNRIDIVAPGVNTYSTYLEGKYVELSGTSMAAPHISGAVALIIAAHRIQYGNNPTPEEVRQYLYDHSIDLGELGFDNLYGYGMFTFNNDGGKSLKKVIKRMNQRLVS